MADRKMTSKVEFEENASRVSLDSGDSLPTLIGKIKKWFSDFKAVAFSGKYSDLTDAPSSLPANGGNADTAQRATCDSGWRQIDTTYIKDMYVSGNVLVFVRGNDASKEVALPVVTVDYVISADSPNAVASSAIKSALDGKSDSWHSHNYAGSSSAGGSAISAESCSGNSATATQATNDVNWQPITSYLKNAYVDGNKIVFVKGDGTTFSIEIPKE